MKLTQPHSHELSSLNPNLHFNDEQQLLNNALTCQQNGDIQQAIEYYQQIITINPNNTDALQLLSHIAYNLQDFPLAETLIRKAITTNGKISEFHKRLGDILSKQQLIPQAKNAYKKALKLMPHSYEAHNNLGLLYHNEQQYKKAIEHFKKAVHKKPDFAIAWNNYGNSLSMLNQYDAAKTTYETAISHNNDFADPWYNLGNLYFQQQAFEQAKDCYTKTIQLNPQHHNAYNNLGCVLREQGKHIDALQQFECAIAIYPKHIDALRNAANTAAHNGNIEKALHYAKESLKINNTDTATLKTFAEIIKHLDFNTYQKDISELILQCFHTNTIDHQLLSKASAKLVRLKHNIDEQTFSPTANIEPLINTLSQDLLFQQLLLNTINEDTQIEILLKTLRHQLLSTFHFKHALTDNEQLLASYIALQMFNNEYVINISRNETAYLKHIHQSTDITDKLSETIIFAMYQPPIEFIDEKKLQLLNSKQLNKVIETLLQRTVLNHNIEKELINEIPCLELNNEETSKQVRQQYEENPYPRWLSTTTQEQQTFQQTPINLKDNANILIAGCGTGKHPITLALQYPKANITAIDLSLNSLAYAKRMAIQYQCHNIKFMQGDLLTLDKLDSSFQLIESIGVLHHLHDPLRGWQNLLNHLEPNGIMKIALYSENARQAIINARERIANLGLSADATDIRDFRQQILNTPENTLLFTLTNTMDFFSLSGCRDLIFHSQEHRFTIPQLQQMLDKLSLKFIGFEIYEAHIQKQYLNQFPDDPSFCNLENWHQFEQQNPNTFRNMYQFHVKKTK